MRIKKTLVLVDFSEGSEAALRVASGIARFHAGELHLLHAYGPRGIVPEPTFLENGRAASERLAVVVDKLAAEGIVATAETHPGSPLDAFDAVEDTTEPDLVVVGARGASRLRTLLVGSVARAVVEHAFAPVLLVRGEPERVPFERVLLASDFSGDAATAAEVARALTTASAQRHVVHVDAVPYEAVATLGSAAVEKLREESQVTLAAEAASFGAEALLRSGNPAHQIVRLGRELACDLVAVGTRGKGTHSWMDGGSVASAVLRRAGTSVLVARRRDLNAQVERHIEDAREEAYESDDFDASNPGLIATLRDVKRLADESRELERELLHEAVAELERVVAQIENDRPRLATSLSALVRALSRMGI